MSGLTLNEQFLPGKSNLAFVRRAAKSAVLCSRVMYRYARWIAFVVVVAILVWQLTSVQPIWLSTLIALFLAFVNLLFGLRIGADSASAYILDLQRLNKLLVDQNSQLQACNLWLVQQFVDAVDGSPDNPLSTTQ